MPAKGWRKPVKPIDGPIREEIEQWLDNGGYDELKRMLIPEFGRDEEKAVILVHETIESALSPVTWKHFDPTKRKKNAVGYQMKMALWRKLIQYRRDHYGKCEPFSLTDSEGAQ